jgi:hypothetical protein
LDAVLTTAAFVFACWISWSFLNFSSSDNLIALYSSLSFSRFLNKVLLTNWKWSPEDWTLHQQTHLRRCCS